LQAGCPAAAVEPHEPELVGDLGGKLVLPATEVPVDLFIAVALVGADRPGIRST
jgi:hypothetical protein